jgi:hypothetical protein
MIQAPGQTSLAVATAHLSLFLKLFGELGQRCRKQEDNSVGHEIGGHSSMRSDPLLSAIPVQGLRYVGPKF